MTARRGVCALAEALEGRRLLAVAVGLSPDNALVLFDTNRPERATSARRISGLAAGDRVVGIDIRPANGLLYGLVDGTTQDRIVQIDLRSGRATQVFNLSVPLVGTNFGVDFNPVPDAMRITSDADQNLRVPFASGATVVDGPLNYAAGDANAGSNPNVVGSAYINSFPGSTATTLFDIDSDRDVLAVQNPPNSGTLSTRGSLGVNTSGAVGFDIQAATSSKNNRGGALATLNVAGEDGTSLYTIDLATGAATRVGAIGEGDVELIDMTLIRSHNGNGNGGGSEFGGWAFGKGKEKPSAEEDDLLA